jgi:RHS repeat-associated protein
MDILTYHYDGSSNRLRKVTDAAPIDKYGFKDDAVNTSADPTNDYYYDSNGNMLSDTNKGIGVSAHIAYNHLNLPTQVSLPNGTISYIYDAAGVKLKKTVNNTAESSLTTTEYAGNYIYENDNLQFFNTAEGYIEEDGSGGFDYIYQYKDHLGNIRLSYQDADGNGVIAQSEIREENNYYPFGLKHRGYNFQQNGRDHTFEYQGVELEESLGFNMMEMDLRQFDPALARWVVLDPIIHHDLSPYNSFDNNPVIFADPSGADSFFSSNFLNQNGGHWRDGLYGEKLNTETKEDEEELKEEPEDIRFRDENGDIIATYYTDLVDDDVVLPVEDPFASNINLNELYEKFDLPDLDIIGIGGNWDFTFVMGGGKSIEAVYFLDGIQKFRSSIYTVSRQNIGANGSAGVYGIFGDYHGDDKNLNHTSYLGQSFSLGVDIPNIIIGGVGMFWSPKNTVTDPTGFKSLFNKEYRSWTGYIIGPGYGAGLQWSRQNTEFFKE